MIHRNFFGAPRIVRAVVSFALTLSAALAASQAQAEAEAVFKVRAIANESPSELARQAGPLLKYLEQKLGMKVEFTPVSDYAAAVETLANKQVDLARFGGFAKCQRAPAPGTEKPGSLCGATT